VRGGGIRDRSPHGIGDPLRQAADSISEGKTEKVAKSEFDGDGKLQATDGFSGGFLRGLDFAADAHDPRQQFKSTPLRLIVGLRCTYHEIEIHFD